MWICIISGIFLGTMFGIFIMCLFQISKKDDISSDAEILQTNDRDAKTKSGE